MEQYLMWMKSKHILNSHFRASMDSFSNSWEEQAFAEDSRGPLGGFIWPPRSYSCSFCQREFRSAQALGGHMNVHRRDRARLKQCLISPQSHENLSNPVETQFPSQICTSDSNPSFVTSKISSPIILGHEDYNVETNLSMGLHLAAPNGASGDEAINRKRRKTAVLPLQFILKPCSDDRYTNFQSEILGLKNSPMEDVDLELRLGDSSTVK